VKLKFIPFISWIRNSAPLVVVVAACLVSAWIFFLVYNKIFIFGSVEGHWYYPYFDLASPLPIWVPLLVLMLLGLLVFIGGRLIIAYEKTTLVAGFCILFLIQFLIHKAYPVSFTDIVESDLSNSFYSTSMRYSAADILAHYSDSTLDLPLHTSSNMPGKLLVYKGLELLTTSPKYIGYIIMLLSTVGALLTYGVCRRLFHDRRTAWYGFVLYALVPGKLFFFPLLNTATPLIILLCLELFLAYLEKKSPLSLVLLGFVMYLLILYEPSPLILGIVFLGILLKTVLEKGISKKEVILLFGIPILAFLTVYSVFYFAFSFDLLSAFRHIVDTVSNFYASEKRGYWVWVVGNSKELFFGAGVPIIIICFSMVWRMLRQWKTQGWNLARWPLESVFLLGLLAAVAVQVFSGVNRGETLRMWIFIEVFFQIPAAFFFAKMAKSQGLFYLTTSILAILSIFTLQRVGFLITQI
jgi:hypothetical protein